MVGGGGRIGDNEKLVSWIGWLMSQSADSLIYLCVLKGIVHEDFRFRSNPNSE